MISYIMITTLSSPIHHDPTYITIIDEKSIFNEKNREPSRA